MNETVEMMLAGMKIAAKSAAGVIAIVLAALAALGWALGLVVFK